MTLDAATRTLVAWCADWPIVAAGIPGDEPAAVLHANRVVACSAAARAEGVARGLRRREAQARCPELTVLAADPDRDARTFEPVAAAVEQLAPRLEILRPGTLAVPTRGPSRYFGGDIALAERITAVVTEVLDGRGEVGIGIADGLVAAVLAARRRLVVPAGESAAFLAPQPVSALDQVLPNAPVLELVGLFTRLGLRTLGDVAALPPATLAGRFGPLGSTASRLARGLDERPPRPRPVPPELTVQTEVDPPAEQVEQVAFLARALAADLGERLSSRGLICTRIAIEVETEHAEVLSRLWRHEGGLGADDLAARARWQLDGWLNGEWAGRPTGGIALLRLVPDEVVPDEGRQQGFWGGAKEADTRAARAVARLQGVLGPDAVLVPQRSGGRSPVDRVRLVPAHAVQLGAPAAGDDADRPWPGHLPAPSPAVVWSDPQPVELLDATGRSVAVTAKGELTGEPATFGTQPIVDTCGPWPCEERWWSRGDATRLARLQVTTTGGHAHLLRFEGGWSTEADYD